MNYKVTCLWPLCMALLLGASCRKSLNSLYQNPDAFTTTSIELLFPTGVSNSVPIGYLDAFGRYLGSFAPMLQLLANNSSNPASLHLYQFVQAASSSNVGAVDFGLWGNYYNSYMPALKEIEKIYQWQLTPAQQAGYKVYYELTKIVEAYNTSRCTDLFGDMPYSQAFTARNSIYNKPVILYAKFDGQQSIYDSLLTDLKNASDFLDTVQLHTDLYPAQQLLASQDILFGGNLGKWSALANSLRLRYAMRISAAEPARSMQEISEIMQDNRSLIIANTGNAYLINAQGGGGLLTAVQQLEPSSTYASSFLVDSIMNPAQDPRLPIFFYTDTSNHNVFKGMPASYGLRNQTAIGVGGTYAYLNPLTFGYNNSMPNGIMIDAADVNFLLAEAAKKGWITGGDGVAAQYYNTGIVQSVLAYYAFYQTDPATTSIQVGTQTYIFQKNTSLVVPTATTLLTWIAQSPYAYNPSSGLAQIALQKYIHTNIMEMDETYAEFRRLGLPKLPADIYSGLQINDSIPLRVPYPTSEAANNVANFNAAAAATNGNSYSVPVWWNKH
jgi:hypothetical protein